MKKLSFLMLLSVLFFACAPKSVEEKELLANAPVMTFKQTEFNFGQVLEGELVVHQFEFTNTGQTGLLIESASATCGCTVPEFPRDTIAPGEKGIIKAVFNSSGRLGLNDKIITISSNAKTVQLHVIGEVLPK